MEVSPEWKIRKVNNQEMLLNEYVFLFKQSTKYQQCPIDCFELLSTSLPTLEFIQLAKALGYCKRFTKGPYLTCYNLGCVKVLSNPNYPCVPCIKIIINPSEAGMSLRQIFKWVGFIVGLKKLKETVVSKVEFKVDLRHTNTIMLNKKVWWFKPFRSVFKHNSSLYLGGLKSDRLVVYDKGIEMRLKDSLTRVELRRRYKKGKGVKRVTIIEFFRTFSKEDPFSEVGIVTSEYKYVDLIVKRFGCVQRDTFVETLKAISKTYQRKRLLESVSIDDKFLSRIYKRQRNKWLYISLK